MGQGNTDKSVLHNHPDITLFEKSNNIVYLIAVSIPNLGNMQIAYTTKMGKYAGVSTEVQQQWFVEAVYYLPVTISAAGVIFTLHDVLKLLDLLALLYMTTQKICNLKYTQHRKFFDDSTFQ